MRSRPGSKHLLQRTACRGKRPDEAAVLPKQGGDPSKRVTLGNALPGPVGGGAYVR